MMVKLDAMLSVEAARLRDVAQIAQAAEVVGFAGLWTPETKHNGFFPLIVAAEHTERIELGTAVAIAFPRNPIVTAQIAWDLQALSRGRFILGLGTQVKAHIERRYGMVWEAPVAKLRDYLRALRAIWHAWQTETPLQYEGPFYRHTLMTPFFSPAPLAHPHIPIYIAGVNPGLARLVGELGDGFHVHPFHSVKYIQEVVRPQVAAGAERAGRSPTDIVFASSAFVISGQNEAALEQMRALAREQIAFYASTPTYRVVLECHGWQEIGEHLSQLARQKRWGEMAALISDDMLDVFAVQAPLDRLADALYTRYEGVLDRVACYLPYVPSELDPVWRDVAAALNQ